MQLRSSVSVILALAVLEVLAAGCGFNGVIEQDEAVKAAWAEVENQYQRRHDLIPNLVAAVKGEANFEQGTLVAVTEARAGATQLKVDASIVDDPVRLQQFEQAQGRLSGALSRLLVASENYPNLKANQAFRDLTAELAGTENRIAVARKRYIDAVSSYNTYVQTFPTMIGAGMRGRAVRPTFSAHVAGTETAPQVAF